jgi:hypothetical protein
MDLNLIAALNHKISALSVDRADDTGELKSVVGHIEAAFRHLVRGQKENDSSALSDAVYRANLAFDCCIKDAYHLLAGRNPSSKSMADMESYLTSHKIFRSRILKLFTDYRQQWRGLIQERYPQTLSQSDVFIALTTVSSFAFLLTDQINERHAYLESMAQGKTCQTVIMPRTDLLSRTVNVVQEFCTVHRPYNQQHPEYSEEQLIAALYGFITSAAPELSVFMKGNLPLNHQYHAALIIIRGSEKVLFELRQNIADEHLPAMLIQTEQDMSDNAIRYGVLFCFSQQNGGLTVEERDIERIRGKLVVLS